MPTIQYITYLPTSSTTNEKNVCVSLNQHLFNVEQWIIHRCFISFDKFGNAVTNQYFHSMEIRLRSNVLGGH